MKTCNWNCVYCQLGCTCRFATSRARFAAARDIADEARAALAKPDSQSIDWITVVGSGEPTLNCELGAIIRELKQLSDRPVAVITNGSLLSDAAVRAELASADAVLPTLDAGTEDLFRRINRSRKALTLERHLDGLRRFREQYEGSLWVEVMLVAGLNDGEPELRAIAERLREVEPDRIDLAYPERPPCEPWVRSTDRDGQVRALAILGAAAHVLPPVPQQIDWAASDPVEAIVAIVTRHPLPEEAIRAHLPPEATRNGLDRLARDGRVRRVRRYDRWFWTGIEGRYRDER